MTRISLLLMLSVFCFSCNNSETKTETKTSEPAETVATAEPKPEDLTPDVMAEIPAKIEGCNALFTYDSVALDKRQYVFMHNQEGLGILQIDGKKVELNRVEKTETGENEGQEIFAADQYKVILTTKKVKQTDKNVAEYEGTLEIYKDISQRKFKVRGKVGC